MTNCIFCKIIAGEIPAKKLYEDENMLIIQDIGPQAKRHYLMIPKEHYASVLELNPTRAETLGKCLNKIKELSDTLGLKNGVRLVLNQGADACQSVFHLHIHVLGGQKLSGKMG
jgi:histidine triad (HIT) family protein